MFALETHVMVSPYSFFRLCVRVGKNDARYLTALRKRLFRAMKEPFPSCRTGSSAWSKRLFRKPEKALLFVDFT